MLGVLLGGLVLRVILGAAIGLGVDESYMVAVATRGFDPAYFEHPPLSFWLAALSAKLFGTTARLVVRLPFILLFLATTWLIFRTTARVYGERAGAFAAVLLNLSLVFSISTGGWVLPDGPLMACMAAALYCLGRIFFPERPDWPWRWWLGAGFCAGYAMLSKYHGAFILIGAVAFVLTSAKQRHWLRHPAPWIASVLALLIFSPVLLWNAQHDWISFRFQGGRGSPGVHVDVVGQSLAGQMGYVLPWIWLPLVVVLWKALRAGPNDARRWFFLCLAAGPIVVFTLAALGGNPGLPHWEAPGYLVAFPLLGAAVAERWQRGDRLVRGWLWTSVALFALIVVVAGSQLATGWVSRVVPSLRGRRDPGREMIDWRGLEDSLRSRGLAPGARRFAAATDWIDAGKLGYALPGATVLCLCEEPHHFAFLAEQGSFRGYDAVIVHSGAPVPVVTLLAPYFDAVDSVGTVPVRRGTSVAMDLTIYRGTGFRPPYPYRWLREAPR